MRAALGSDRRIYGAFSAAAAGGVALSGAIASGPPILAIRWGLLWRLALWGIVWIAGVSLALRLPRRRAVAFIFVAAVALRLAALAGPPTTSDDLYRYAWDGRVQASGTDPYRDPPASSRLGVLHETWLWPSAHECASLRRDPGCTRINRPADRTIYPPVAQAWFSLVYRIGGIATRHKLWQVAGLITDMAVVGLLAIGLRRWDHDPRWLALYALSPIPVLEIVNNAHVDGLAIMFVIAALVVGAPASPTRVASKPDTTAAYLPKLTSATTDIAVGLLLGAAALVKVYPGLLVIAVAGVCGSRALWRVFRSGAAALALSAAFYLPHIVIVGWRVLGYLPGYLREEHYDRGGRFLLVGGLGIDGSAAVVVGVGWLLAAVAWVVWKRPPLAQGSAVLLGVLFVTATPVQPWYATSLVAVAALTGWPWWCAIAVGGYPYFFAVILDHPHAVGIGRSSYATALAIVAAWLSLRTAGRAGLGRPRWATTTRSWAEPRRG